jgi:hypothetical protein
MAATASFSPISVVPTLVRAHPAGIPPASRPTSPPARPSVRLLAFGARPPNPVPHPIACACAAARPHLHWLSSLRALSSPARTSRVRTVTIARPAHYSRSPDRARQSARPRISRALPLATHRSAPCTVVCHALRPPILPPRVHAYIRALEPTVHPSLLHFSSGKAATMCPLSRSPPITVDGSSHHLSSPVCRS